MKKYFIGAATIALARLLYKKDGNISLTKVCAILGISVFVILYAPGVLEFFVTLAVLAIFGYVAIGIVKAVMDGSLSKISSR